MEFAMTSTGAQVILAIIPIVGIGIGGIIVFFYLLWHHHEIKLQILAKTYHPRRFDLKTFSLLTGMLLTGTGIILSLFFILIDGLTYTLLGGLIPLVLGVSLLLFYKINPDFREKDGE